METRTYLFAGAASKMAVAAAEMLRQQGHRVIGISTKEDTGDYDAFYTVDKYTFGEFPAIEGRIDGLVYFPGTINLKPFHRLSGDDFVNDFEINALGAAAFVQAYTAGLKLSEGAAILFISSVAVGTGMPFHSSVAMAKGALEGLTRALAAELAPKIRVNCIAPSLTDTPLADKFLSTPEKTEASRQRNPLKKVGSTADVASAVQFLISPAASWITGQVIAVDGGMGILKL